MAGGKAMTGAIRLNPQALALAGNASIV